MGNTVLDVDFSFYQKWGPTTLTAAAYGPATDIVVNIEGLNQKVVLVKNVGADSLTYTILGSIDGGDEWDFVVKADTTVASAAQDLTVITDYYTDIKIRLKKVANDTIAVVKSAGQSI